MRGRKGEGRKGDQSGQQRLGEGKKWGERRGNEWERKRGKENIFSNRRSNFRNNSFPIRNIEA